ncbi:cytidylyltransferase domain-containing protein [Pontibacter akesuensis]|uniref:Spore coat polysaccharide biosynthesis protein SpsF n=1 Tax=Pontibacter akesuensis TaxID=388950 RepID=A0A1I7FMW1_9BACT|nr:glycosyltransferase family protein [Pontibacter akesuensis]GHA61413.1 spore coat protein [Pontibacter akesuensis]SFU37557.1 spore coat polysaccharide biosynthesis protein SpsF [Pontibacter akesuensis]
MVKVGAIIQARLGSERLPNKALLPLPFGGGPSLLQHVVNRAKAASSEYHVIVATSATAADDQIQQLCEQEQIHCFRASLDDVLARFSDAAEKYKLDVVIRLTGDNPFIFPKKIELAVTEHLKSGAAYTLTEGLPLGTNLEVISASALLQAAAEATEPDDREHVTPYIRRTESFRKHTIHFESDLKALRLTVDYPSDYALASMLYEKLSVTDPNFGLDQLEQLLRDHPWLLHVNSQNTQRMAFASEKEELAEARKVLQQRGFTRVLKYIKEKNA